MSYQNKFECADRFRTNQIFGETYQSLEAAKNSIMLDILKLEDSSSDDVVFKYIETVESE